MKGKVEKICLTCDNKFISFLSDERKFCSPNSSYQGSPRSDS